MSSPTLVCRARSCTVCEDPVYTGYIQQYNWKANAQVLFCAHKCFSYYQEHLNEYNIILKRRNYMMLPISPLSEKFKPILEAFKEEPEPMKLDG